MMMSQRSAPSAGVWAGAANPGLAAAAAAAASAMTSRHAVSAAAAANAAATAAQSHAQPHNIGGGVDEALASRLMLAQARTEAEGHAAAAAREAAARRVAASEERRGAEAAAAHANAEAAAAEAAAEAAAGADVSRTYGGLSGTMGGGGDDGAPARAHTPPHTRTRTSTAHAAAPGNPDAPGAHINLSASAAGGTAAGHGLQSYATRRHHPRALAEAETAARLGTDRDTGAGAGAGAVALPSGTRGVYFGTRLVAFPPTAVGTAARVKVQVCNSSGVDLTVRLTALTPPFKLRHLRFVLRARSFCLVPLKFSPRHVGYRETELGLEATDAMGDGAGGGDGDGGGGAWDIVPFAPESPSKRGWVRWHADAAGRRYPVAAADADGAPRRVPRTPTRVAPTVARGDGGGGMRRAGGTAWREVPVVDDGLGGGGADDRGGGHGGDAQRDATWNGVTKSAGGDSGAGGGHSVVYDADGRPVVCRAAVEVRAQGVSLGEALR